MRATTAIVGAIAVSSCLIALALVLTSGKSKSAAPPPEGRRAQTPSIKQTGEPSPAGASTPIQCNVEVTVEGASCRLGKSVLATFRRSGFSEGGIKVAEPQGGEELSFECIGEAPTICSSPTGVTVYLAP
ncbi:MAG: hypothetical protein ACM3JL_01780 [Nitrososphaerota archaeon]